MSNLKSWAAAFAGTVVDVQRWTDTNVSTSGGNVWTTGNRNFQTPITVHVDQTHRQLVYVRSEDGNEQTFQLGRDVDFRKGSRFVAVWGSLSGAKSGDYLYLGNEDTGRFVAKPVRRASGPGVFNGFFFGLLAAGAALLIAAQPALYGKFLEAHVDSVATQVAPREDAAYAKLCPAGNRKIVPAVLVEGKPYCTKLISPWEIMAKPVRASGTTTGWACECPTPAERLVLHKQYVRKYSSYFKDRYNAYARWTIAAVGLLAWGIAGSMLSKRRRAKRDRKWNGFIDRIEAAAAAKGLRVDTRGISTEGLRASRS